MEIFAPDYLPGVGMGDLASITAISGLLGLAVTSGIMVAQGWIGSAVFVLSSCVLLMQKDHHGGAVTIAAALLGTILGMAIIRWWLDRRAKSFKSQLVGVAADAPDSKVKKKRFARCERWSHGLAIVGVVVAGAAVGFAWAEWNEVPFRLDDLEGAFGIMLGIVGASIGGDASWRFIRGATNAGGSAVMVGFLIVVGAWILNALSVYVPFVGGVVLILSLILAVRLRRRARQTYKGLRILS